MEIMNEELEKYYNYLKGAGADVPDTYSSFEQTLNDVKVRQQYYEYLKKDNFDVPDTYDSFSNTLFAPVKKKEATQTSPASTTTGATSSLPSSPSQGESRLQPPVNPLEPTQQAPNSWDAGMAAIGMPVALPQEAPPMQEPAELIYSNPQQAQQPQQPIQGEEPFISPQERMAPPDIAQSFWKHSMQKVGLSSEKREPVPGETVMAGMYSAPPYDFKVVDRPYRPDLKGFVLDDIQLKSRSQNEKLKPWWFSGSNDPWASPKFNRSGATEKELDRDINWEQLADKVEKGEIDPKEYLNYEGQQQLEYTLRQRDEARMKAQLLIGEGEDVMTPISGMGDKKLYDLKTFEEVNVSKKDVEGYLDKQAQRLFGVDYFEGLEDNKRKYILQKFAEKYSDEETLKTMFKDAGLDFDVSRLKHAYSSFAQGALSMGTSAAVGVMRIAQDYMDALGELINPSGQKPSTPLGEQRYHEDKEFGYQQGKDALENKYLSAIGAYKKNPKYQESFWINTVPSAFGSAAGFILGSGGASSSMLVTGALSGGDMQASQAYQAGASLDDAFNAQLAGMAIGSSEALPFMRIFGRFSSPVKSAILREMVAGGGVEFLQETMSGILNNLTAQQLYDEKKRVLDGVGEEGAAGALVGALFGGVGAAVKKSKPQSQPTNQEAQNRMGRLYEGEQVNEAESEIGAIDQQLSNEATTDEKASDLLAARESAQKRADEAADQKEYLEYQADPSRPTNKAEQNRLARLYEGDKSQEARTEMAKIDNQLADEATTDEKASDLLAAKEDAKQRSAEAELATPEKINEKPKTEAIHEDETVDVPSDATAKNESGQTAEAPAPAVEAESVEEDMSDGQEEPSGKPKFNRDEGETVRELSSRPRTKTALKARIRGLRQNHTEYDNGQYSVVRDRDGAHIVNNSKNEVVSRDTRHGQRISNEVIRQHISENFDSFEDPDAVTEAAAIWDANRPKRNKRGSADMGMETIIADEGLGMSREDFERYGDANAITDEMARAYNMDGRKSKIDAELEEINRAYFGDESKGITPEDVIDHMTRYPGGERSFREEARKRDNGVNLDERDVAAQKFRELTGFDINDLIADQVFREDSRRFAEKLRRDPAEESRKAAEATQNEADAVTAEEAAAQEKREVQIQEASGNRGGNDGGAGRGTGDAGGGGRGNRTGPGSYRGVEGTGNQRRRSFFNRVLEDPNVPQKVKDLLSAQPKTYAQVNMAEVTEVARAAIASMKRAGASLEDIFYSIKWNTSFNPSDKNSLLQNPLYGVLMSTIIAHQAARSGREDLAAEINMWQDYVGLTFGRAIKALDNLMPESVARRAYEEARETQRERTSKKGKSGKSIDQELEEVYDEVRVTQEQVEAAMESEAVKKAMERMENGFDSEVETEVANRVERRKKKKGKVSEGKNKVKQGLELLRGLDNTAQITLAGLSPNQLKGVKLVVEGLIQQGIYKLSILRDMMAEAFRGQNVDSDALALEIWRDSSLGDTGQSLQELSIEDRKQQAIESLANRIVSRAKDKPKSRGDLLDRIVSELTSKAAEAIPKTKQEKITATEKVAEMVRNQSLSEEVWDEAREAVKNKIESDKNLDATQKEDVIARLDDYFSLFVGTPFGHARARQMIREGERDLGESVKDIARQHYARAEESRRTLAQKLVQRTGLSGKSAEMLEKAIAAELKEMNKEQQEKAIRQHLGEPTIPMVNRINNSIAQRAVDMINMGALSTEEFKSLFGRKYGFAEITPQVQQEIEDIIAQINLVDGGEFRRRKMSEFNAMLDRLDNKHTAFYAARLVAEHMYNLILSGVPTYVRAGVGVVMSVGADLIASTIVNVGKDLSKGRLPELAVRGWVKYAKDMRKGVPFFKETIRTGYSELESTDLKGNYSILREVINRPILDTIRNIANAKTVGGKTKHIGNLVYKSAFYLPSKITRSLMATDAIFHYGQKGFYRMVETYNAILAEGVLDDPAKKLWTEVHKKMRDGANFKEQAEIKAAEEVKILKDAGYEVNSDYKKKRVTELMEIERDQEIEDYARWRAKKGTLTNKPMYRLGDVVYPLFTSMTSASKNDAPGTVFAKTWLKFIFPILRVPTNHVNMWLDYTPIGIVRAFFQVPKGDEFSDASRADMRMEHLAKAALGTAVYTWMFSSIFDFDDEDGTMTLKDDENSWIKITAEGWTKSKGYLYDKSISEDRKDWSIQIKKEDGSWTEPFNYRDTPLGFLFSSLGYMSDAIRFNEKDDKPSINDGSSFMSFLALKGGLSPLAMVKEQNYLQGLDDLGDVLKEGTYMDAFMKLLTRPAKTMVLPNLYAQAGKAVATVQGKTATRAAKYKDDFGLAFQDNMLKNVPYFDQYVSDKQFDQFGYPILVKFEIPYVPDAFFEYAKKIFAEQSAPDKKAWQIVYKYSDVTIGDYISINSMRDGLGGEFDIDHDDRVWFEARAAELLRQRVEASYSDLDNMGPEELQLALKYLKQQVRNLVKAEFFNKKTNEEK